MNAGGLTTMPGPPGLGVVQQCENAPPAFVYQLLPLPVRTSLK